MTSGHNTKTVTIVARAIKRPNSRPPGPDTFSRAADLAAADVVAAAADLAAAVVVAAAAADEDEDEEDDDDTVVDLDGVAVATLPACIALDTPASVRPVQLARLNAS